MGPPDKARTARPMLAALVAVSIHLGVHGAEAADPLEAVKQSIRLKQFKEAQTRLEQLALAGNADAQYLLAAFYLNGLNGPRAEAAARTWLEKAAARGHARASRSLKALTESGDPFAGAGNEPTELPVVTESSARNEALWLAAWRGDAQRVQALANRASVDSVDAFGRGALARAADGGHSEVVDILRRAGAKVDTHDAFGTTPLMLAARAKRSAAVEALLKAGADVNLSDQVGNTALMYAAAGGNVVSVDLLLKSSSSPNARNAQGWSALDFAEWAEASDSVRLLKAKGATSTLRSHHPDSVNGILRAKADLYSGWDDVAVAATRRSTTLLESLPSRMPELNANASDGASPLMVAVRSDAPKALDLLLSRDRALAGPHLADALMLAARSGSVETAKVLLAHGASPDSRSGDGEPAIVAAARAGQTGMVRLLASAHADVSLQDRSGRSALIQSVESSNGEMMRELLAAGASLYTTDKAGRSALWYAAHAGASTAVAILREHGANVDQADAAGVSPLAAASQTGSTLVVEQLLSSNVQVDARTNSGDTPLLLATAAGHLQIVEKLLAARADKDAQNQFGDTALIIASRNGEIALVKRLLAAGATARVRNQDRATAADVATARSFTEVADLLKR